MPVSLHIGRVTLLLVSISILLVQVALEDRGASSGPVLLAASVAGAALLWMLSRKHRWSDWSVGAVTGVLVLALLPVAWDIASRLLMRVGDPYEVQLACVLRNTMLALAVTPRLPRATVLAAFSSFFLVMFSFLWATDNWAVGLLVAYAVVGAWWLFAAYWEGLGGRFADSSERAVPVRPAVAVIAGIGLAALLAVPPASRSTATRALLGFFPSSGGTQWNDPFAHGGVGDGDQMVAAKDQASGFGPIDTDVFLESKMPSLYDTFSEFSEAAPTKKRMRRAIPLAPSEMKANHQNRGMTQQATREFDTVRQPTARTSETEDRLSAALLLVKGRTPLHLALEAYDRWDGRSLFASGTQSPLATELRDDEDDGGRRWLDLSVTQPAELFTVTARSQVRVVNLKTERVPTPAGARSVTLKRLHSGTMFKFTSDGSLAMPVDHVPQLTIFEFLAGLRDHHSAPLLYRKPTDAGDGPIDRLAQDWVRGVPEGWAQVEAVVARLRRDYTHDQSAMIPADAEDSVAHFLRTSKRGPDYLFAASAAVMLRSLGYDTRVRSGFYVSPERYERTADLTPVLAEDAHFWVEVRTRAGARVTPAGQSLEGVWAAVEPTPGYELLYAPETPWARLGRAAAAFFRALAAHPIALCLALVGTAGVVAARLRLLDAALVGWWSVFSRGAGSDRLARLTLRLLEWRAWAHHQARPAGTPLGRWTTLRDHSDFVALVSWALYGGGAPSPLHKDRAYAVCRSAIRTPLRSATRPNNAWRFRTTPSEELPR